MLAKNLLKKKQNLSKQFQIKIMSESSELIDYNVRFDKKDRKYVRHTVVYLGLTSGSFLTGYSVGSLVAASSSQGCISGFVSRIVAQKLWEELDLVIISGLVGTLILGISSYSFWCGSKGR